ncbi:uncharacterized protein LOC130713321 [Lotus japonicus]|uniref:uncharacterized protein LOC130713321 n=1 Tax=Lotus japonicus TaxID=34305 RepID=UPI00258463D9|nr:uncharacterized protein LOC130713321 [Lotus japonicus]
MASRIDDLAKVDASKETWTIVAKVSHLWLSPSLYGSKLPFSMDMILMDDKGCKIHATVRKTLIYRFQSSLTEGKVYHISYFGVGESGHDFRPTEHPFKIKFDIQTYYLTRVRVECAFFGKYVSEVIGYLSSVDATNAVVVVQCCKIKPFKGKTSIQNVYGATRVLFNPQIQEAAPLRAR